MREHWLINHCMIEVVTLLQLYFRFNEVDKYSEGKLSLVHIYWIQFMRERIWTREIIRLRIETWHVWVSGRILGMNSRCYCLPGCSTFVDLKIGINRSWLAYLKNLIQWYEGRIWYKVEYCTSLEEDYVVTVHYFIVVFPHCPLL